MCSRQNTKMLALDPLVYQALLDEDEKDRQPLQAKEYYSEDIISPRRYHLSEVIPLRCGCPPDFLLI